MRGLRWGEAGKGILGQICCEILQIPMGRGSRQREQQVLRTDAKAEALILWPPDEKS